MMEKSLRWAFSLLVPIIVAGVTGYSTASYRSAQADLITERRTTTLEVRLDDTVQKINQQMQGYASMMNAFKEWYRDTTEKQLDSIEKRLVRIEAAIDAQRAARPR